MKYHILARYPMSQTNNTTGPYYDFSGLVEPSCDTQNTHSLTVIFEKIDFEQLSI